MQTGLVPSANGSAYLELEAPRPATRTFISTTSTLKLSCSVHGPKPVARTSSFSPNLQLTASVKFAPFAMSRRRGYVRDATERDLGTHLENALKGVIIPDRWPKSAIDIAVTVLEGEEEHDTFGARNRGLDNVGLMNVLSGCITVSMAALADARIDCVDLLCGGVAAVVPSSESKIVKVLDPRPAEHEDIVSACVVGYLPSRDEVTEVWARGSFDVGNGSSHLRFDDLLDSAISAAKASQSVLQEVILESISQSLENEGKKQQLGNSNNDIEMK